MTGLSASGIVGTPAAFPARWLLIGGILIGPGASLKSTDLAGLDLSEADLAGVSSGFITGKPAALPAKWSLIKGFLIGPAANLKDSMLTGLNLVEADLAGANLALARLDKVRLTLANLKGASFAGAEAFSVDLQGADISGASFAGAAWLNTKCPDGTNSNSYLAGCFSPRDTIAPSASPVPPYGVLGRHGWYVSPVTVIWNWTDNGTIPDPTCTFETSSTANGGAVLVAGTCTDLAGNVGHASVRLKIDQTRPQVTVTGVLRHHRYHKGHVPKIGCRATDRFSGVARQAKLTVTRTGRPGSGLFKASCAGAVTVAGLRQVHPAQIVYTVVS